jgi:4-amino-4-deoxy-L-arabinose transferase-like glycosyltransferase
MKNLLKRFDRWDLFLSIALFFTFVAVSFLPFAPKKFGDEVFHREAKKVSEFAHGAATSDQVVISRAPGPVIFYSVPYLLVAPGSSDDSYWSVGFVWTFFWMLIALLLVRRSARNLFGDRAGLLAAFATVLIPFNVYYSYGNSAEPIAYLGTAVAVYGWSRLSTVSNSFSGLTLFSIGLFVLVLSRPNAILLIPIGIAILLFFWKKSAQNHKQGLLALACVAVAFFGTFLLLSLQSKAWQSGNFAHVFFHGRFQFRTEPWDWRYWDDKSRQGSKDHELFTRTEEQIATEIEKSGTSLEELKMEWATNDFISNPSITLQQFGIRLMTLNLSLVNSKSPRDFKFGPIEGKVAYTLFHILVNALSVAVIFSALVFLVRNKNSFFELWPLWGVWFSLLLFHALIYSEPRYLFPGQPGLVVLASGIWSTWSSRVISTSASRNNPVITNH